LLLFEKEVSSLTKQKQGKISKMFGVNGNTLIFASAFGKGTEIIDSDKEKQKILLYHLIKNFNAVSLRFCKKISS